MPELTTRRRLDQPRGNRRFSFDIDPETFGRLSENLARFLGTGKYLFWQTLTVLVWVIINVVAGVNGVWDKYPFQMLNLVFSTQAAYAAPLILLAQNRQDDRDRVSLDGDRSRAAQTKADTEFLARELAALRVAIGEIATRDYLRGEIEKLRGDLDRLTADGDEAGSERKQAKGGGKAGKRPEKPVERALPVGKRKTADSGPALSKLQRRELSGSALAVGPAESVEINENTDPADAVTPSPGVDDPAADR